MNKITLSFLFVIAVLAFASCKKDEGKLPNIAFKTGGTYVSTSDSVTAGSAILIGINASKAEDEDVLKQFDVTKSVNGASGSSVFSKSLSGTEGDSYTYDYIDTVSTTVGTTQKYTFTVTNRDGLTNQVSLTLTSK